VKVAAQVCRFCGGAMPIELTDEVTESDPPAKDWTWG
jgi:hypothetical protein